MTQPMIIDTDMALDDWMAILYLLRHPGVQVKAITIAATGEAHAKPGARNALRLLALADHAMIPVAAGSKQPLQGQHVFPWIIRFMMDRLLFLKAPLPLGKPASQDAVHTIINILEQSQESVSFVALGPLTNLAAVIQQRPYLAEKVSEITFMGGALDVPGNIEGINRKINNAYAEWNVFIDPYAANLVFSSGIPITMVPLDATNQVPLTSRYLAKMEAVQGSAALDFVRRAARGILRLSSPERQFYMWDPLAAMVAMNPEIARFEERSVHVDEEEGPLSGRVETVLDGAKVRICTQVDQVAFEKLCLQGIQ